MKRERSDAIGGERKKIRKRMVDEIVKEMETWKLSYAHRQLDIAAKRGDVERYIALVKASEQFRHISFDHPLLLATKHLRTCSERGFADLVEYLVRDRGVDVNATNYNGEGAFFFLYRLKCAHSRTLNNNNAAPIHLATTGADEETVKVLIRYHANVNVCDRKHQNTPLHICAAYGLGNIAKLLIEHGANVNALNRTEQTPLHRAGERHVSMYRGIYGAAEILIQNGAIVDALDVYFFTPLHYASKSGRLSIMDLLIKNGANVNSCSVALGTPLHVTASNQRENSIRLLCRSNADVNAIFDSEHTSNTPMDEYLLNHHACYISTVRFLICYGAEMSRKISDMSQLDTSVKEEISKIKTALELIRNGESVPKSLKLFTSQDMEYFQELALMFCFRCAECSVKAFNKTKSYLTFHGIFMSDVWLQ